MPRLRRSDWRSAGIRRRRRGKGFSYYWDEGGAVTDPETLERISKLAVPPAWADVWICPWPHGHIQAVGTDSAGRRQYRYHDAWRTLRDHQKFEHVLEFACCLPRLRDQVEQDLALDGLSKARVLASTIRLLDLGFFRIGGEDYARQHDTFGIASLQRRHVKVSHGQMVFDYAAKGSVRRVVTIVDNDVLALIEALKRRRGGDRDLFVYRSEDGWSSVRSGEVNAYIREAAGDDCSAKDFRTWSATVLAAVQLARAAGSTSSQAARTRAIRAVVKATADQLGNTPAVCRRSYIDPRLLDRFYFGETISPALEAIGTATDIRQRSVREAIEAAVVDLIDREREPRRSSEAVA